MNSRRPYLNLSLLGLGIVSACSLTVPSEDEVFGGGKAGSAAAGAMSSAGTAGVGTNSDAGSGATPAATGGTAANEPSGGTGPVIEGGAPAGADNGGAGGEPSTPTPKPTGEIVNPGFEQDLNGWTVDPISLKTSSSVVGKPTVFAQGAPNVMPSDGNFALSTWDMTKAYTVKVFQVVEGLEDGTYELSAQVSNKTGVKRAQLYAKNCGGKPVTPAPPPNTTSLVEVKIDAIEVVGGSCEIGIDIDAAAADWVNADSFKLTKLPPP